MESNPLQSEKLWFRRKTYGWGWTPVTWQGWLVVILYAVAVIILAFTIDESSPANEIAFTFILPLIILTILLIRISYKKGESPKWQWGKKKDISKS